ncbi:uncharacterized protein SPPG_06699 [Spizellomyces punctatus DAOM BR117]|uniref:Lupus La protein n=1 Tax=Spizellomyces punctatus (strain DAOM BR117) TaxID=645134 RepID=A0A0L0HBI5_SPIPD|nr:uncharacterized protein SPPG_06699 [Spizellomyces punctatus DAOM BR117]KNC98306.1 hypothetical protein SPPG_06699 [Spizellomyces punctatus DAOM BR117]|eukprot:XP_016606346.1 hypothetical protein SPPG_06699 [Spizellomyces punctatus DAOM BR117]
MEVNSANVEVESEVQPETTTTPLSDSAHATTPTPPVPVETSQPTVPVDEVTVPVPVNLETASDEVKAKILKQVEYYFGDANLPRDKFLISTINENPEGWVSIETLLKFNRLRSISDDPLVIADALRQSAELLEVSDDGKLVRRRTQLKPRFAVHRKTIYVKGFPPELSNIIDEIEGFFSNFGKVHNVRIRRDENRAFKGSVFVEFKEIPAAENVSQMQLEFQGHPLVIMMKDEYVNMKLREGPKDQDGSHMHVQRPYEEFPQLNYLERHDFRRPGAHSNYGNRQQGPALLERPEGALAFFEGVAPMTLREDIQHFFARHERVRWINFNIGEQKGSVMFSYPDAAARVVEKLGNGGVVQAPNGIGGGTTTVRAATKDEEMNYWLMSEKARTSLRGKRGGHRGRGGDRGSRERGGRRNDRFQRRPEKVQMSTEVPGVENGEPETSDLKSNGGVKRSAEDEPTTDAFSAPPPTKAVKME